jgi:3-oxoacyl-[acyl-carrier protein] reductase
MFSGKALENKVAIVTGAGQGIGAGIARAYGAQAAKVAVVDWNLETAAVDPRRRRAGRGVQV